ncbi:MAG: hypothetical protein AAF533_04405 [Acidobacteriota bacterium]
MFSLRSIVLFLPILIVSNVQAGSRWLVEQQDPSQPGSPYEVLGCVEAVTTDLPIEEFYDWGPLFPEPWYHGPADAPQMQPESTQLFFVDGPDGQVHLIGLHDAPGDADGGSFTARITSNRPLTRILGDDPDGATSDTYSPEAGVSSTSHVLQNVWGDWSADGTIMELETGCGDPQSVEVMFLVVDGLSDWRVASVDGSHVPLELEGFRSVRLTRTVTGSSCDPACDALGFEHGLDEGGLSDVWFPQVPTLTVTGSPGPAVLFDTSSPTCEDDDLVTPGFGTGNTECRRSAIIVQELGSDCLRDDEREGGVIELRWDDAHQLISVGILDADEEGGSVAAYDAAGDLLCETEIPALDDNSWQLVPCEAIGVRSLEVRFAGSGALTDVACRALPSFAPAAGPGQGNLPSAGVGQRGQPDHAGRPDHAGPGSPLGPGADFDPDTLFRFLGEP